MRIAESQENIASGFVHVRSMDLHALTQAVLHIFDETDVFPQRVPSTEAAPPDPSAAKAVSSAFCTENVETLISQMLLRLGIPPHVHGYRFLRLAILTALEDETVLDSLTHGLYPIIAAHFNTTATRAERSMRHAIELAWERGNGESFEQLFPRCSFYTDNCPTIRKFLALTVEKARILLKDR